MTIFSCAILSVMKSIITKIPVRDILEAENSTSLFADYTKESKTKFTPDSDVNMDIYYTMEDAGILDCYGAFNGSTLVGFCVATTNLSPNYNALATSVMALYVDKAHRKFGTAKGLIDEIESMAKSKGSTMVLLSSTVNGVLGRFAKTIGYSESNVIYVKDVSE